MTKETRIKNSMVQIALFGRINASYFPLEKSAPNLIPITKFVRVLGVPKISELIDLLEKQAHHAGRETDLFTREAKDLLVDASEMKPGKLISLANQALLHVIISGDKEIDQKNNQTGSTKTKEITTYIVISNIENSFLHKLLPHVYLLPGKKYFNKLG